MRDSLENVTNSSARPDPWPDPAPEAATHERGAERSWGGYAGGCRFLSGSSGARRGARCVRFRCRCWCWRRCREHRSSEPRRRADTGVDRTGGIDPIGRGVRDDAPTGRNPTVEAGSSRRRGASGRCGRSRRGGGDAVGRPGHADGTPWRCSANAPAPASFSSSNTTSVPIQVPEFRASSRTEPRL